MSKTIIQAELPPDLVSQAQRFVSQSGQRDLNALLAEALQDYFIQHRSDMPVGGPQTDRQRVIQALAAQAASCARPGWDGHGAEPVTPVTYRQACRVVESLPQGVPLPDVGAEPDGHLTLEWYRSPNHVVSLSVGPEWEMNYAALLGERRRRTGSEVFQGGVPTDLLQLVRQVFAT
ncbi:MAG: hypothetical protein KIT22_10500 [Verrucomicrobiae bacterium]|nr:hypothetical protein [Verrucomicrobiae bacterium]